MNCKHCGFVSNNGERFCKNCGNLLVPQDESNNQNTGLVQMQNININNNEVNPSMKKWAILSIVVPMVGIIWYWFIGLSFYLAILIAAVGLSFAKKGEVADKRLSMIGKIANGILIGMTIIMFIMYCIGLV